LVNAVISDPENPAQQYESVASEENRRNGRFNRGERRRGWRDHPSLKRAVQVVHPSTYDAAYSTTP
jgi:hypothetical protein